MSEYKDTLAILLKNKGISQRELAKKSGLDESTISLYMSGTRTPNLKNHVKLCEALGVDINFFTH
ncbi:helix-turn-helix domain-containing protein [Planococcus sp. X10-3]|uniref:helix-turn-helix domain-containing protein n=1 Tax=Planococcus sp. X10-3 TaxID=3061240 RepID=UPI003BB1D0BF